MEFGVMLPQLQGATWDDARAFAYNTPQSSRRIPLGIGAAGDRMLDLVAAEADEWNCPAGLLPVLDDRLKVLDDRLAHHGRDVRRTLQIVFTPGRDSTNPMLGMFNPELGLIGSADRMQQRVGELKERGFDGFFGFIGSVDEVDQMGEMLPALRAV